MRHLDLTNALLAIIFGFLFSACGEAELDGGFKLDDEIKWSGTLKEKDCKLHTIFLTTRIYYLDEDGNDMIELNNLETYPVSNYTEVSFPLIYKKDVYADSDKDDPTQVRYVYNSKSNRVAYDAEEQLNYFSMAVYYDGTSEYSFPVYVDDRIDWVKLSVLYTYSFEGIPGRFTSHFVKITDLEYNGKQLYSDPTDDFYDYYDNKTFPNKIFVRKTTDGVTVSFAR